MFSIYEFNRQRAVADEYEGSSSKNRELSNKLPKTKWVFLEKGCSISLTCLLVDYFLIK
jgi:hypothetical protein